MKYGGNPALKPLLIGMLTTVNETTFQYLQTLEAFTAHPDIIEDYFSLVFFFLFFLFLFFIYY